jgi:zinc transporter ZupT
MVSATLCSDQNLMAGILVSLASGSFLYISLIEILPTELHKPHAIGWKLLAMIIGWLGMVILAFWA